MGATRACRARSNRTGRRVVNSFAHAMPLSGRRRCDSPHSARESRGLSARGKFDRGHAVSVDAPRPGRAIGPLIGRARRRRMNRAWRHERPPGSPSFRPYPRWVRIRSAPTAPGGENRNVREQFCARYLGGPVCAGARFARHRPCRLCGSSSSYRWRQFPLQWEITVKKSSSTPGTVGRSGTSSLVTSAVCRVVYMVDTG